MQRKQSALGICVQRLRTEESLTNLLPSDPKSYEEYTDWKAFSGKICFTEYESDYEIFIKKMLKEKGIEYFKKKKEGRPYEI